MATVRLIGPDRWNGVLPPGESAVISTGILVQEPPDSGNVSISVTVRAFRTAPAVFAASIRDVSVVTNDPPGGLNLNFVLVNTHATQTLTSAAFTYCIITD